MNKSSLISYPSGICYWKTLRNSQVFLDWQLQAMLPKHKIWEVKGQSSLFPSHVLRKHSPHCSGLSRPLDSEGDTLSFYQSCKSMALSRLWGTHAPSPEDPLYLGFPARKNLADNLISQPHFTGAKRVEAPYLEIISNLRYELGYRERETLYKLKHWALLLTDYAIINSTVSGFYRVSITPFTTKLGSLPYVIITSIKQDTHYWTHFTDQEGEAELCKVT